MNQVTELRKSLAAMLDMHDAVCKRVNWGASFLDGKTIQLMNEVPAQARKLLEESV